MTTKPELGAAAGQKYPVLRSIQTFLGQMAEGGARPASTVIKELLQNADDAGATEVSVVLDERTPPPGISQEYADLLAPAVFVRNNARFRLAHEVLQNEQDDFSAICDVRSGHKRAQATAAGRFGIGFNSVYFLTDTPLFFSRREVHVFDLLHKLFNDDGWRFPLDDFPVHSGSLAGAVKPVLEWCLPKAVLLTHSFSQFASEPQGDFNYTVFRLPLRRSREGVDALYSNRFPEPADRIRVLNETVDEAVRSILFLKNVHRILFAVLRDRELEPFARVDATAPPAAFAEFLNEVRQQDGERRPTEKRSCAFDRTISRRDFVNSTGASSSETTTSLSFHVRHLARFDDEELSRLRERLRLNGERAVPWVAIGVPLDPQSCHLDGTAEAAWRVFLPLLEEGPCACVLSGAFFVGPSRQHTEFRLNESDEGKRRTEWNQLLVERALVGLLQNISADLPSLAPRLLEEHPKDYVGLFPKIIDSTDDPANLTEFLCRCFSAGPWALRLHDVWGNTFDLLVGDGGDATVLEFVPEWLSVYRDRFPHLTNDHRRFVRYVLGDALAARMSVNSSITIRRRPSADVALQVLRHSRPPDHKDLRQLLQLVGDREQPADSLNGVWAFVSASSDDLLRFDAKTLYIVVDHSKPSDPILEQLRKLRLPFVQTEWVRKGTGLTDLVRMFRSATENVVEPTAATALELLRRLPESNAHDQVTHDYEIKPIVDFLASQPSARMTPDLRLGILVRTANLKVDRRRLGFILLKPTQPTSEDVALWEIWFRPLFAEVDPGFAREIQRLLGTHSSILEMLHSRDCQVAIPRASEALGILAGALDRQPDLYDALEREINIAAHSQPDLATRAASAILEIADAGWDSLNEAQRHAVLALPIHRRADGSFGPLVSADDENLTTVAGAFRLQSQDDIADAPIRMPTCKLLQTVNTTVKQFYRRRLRLEEHGRVSVLKDVFRQIGSADLDNKAMLRYLVSYYEDTLARLERSGDETDAVDARELRTLFNSARTVPCVDGAWLPANSCKEAWQVVDHLRAQQWDQKRLPSLVEQIFAGERVASVEKWVRELLPRLQHLTSLSPPQIAVRAVTSEAADLDFADRVRLLRDNRRDFPETIVTRSRAVGLAQIPVFGGRASLAAAEWIQDSMDLPVELLRLLAPNGIQLSSFATEFGLRTEDVPTVLKAFQVQPAFSRDIDDRLVQQFAQVWPTVATKDRLGLLRYVGLRKLASRLKEQAVALDTVLVSSKPCRWLVPAAVVSPQWAATQPPCVGPDTQPAVAQTDLAVVAVWDLWCGLSTFGDVLGLVLDGAERAGSYPQTAANVYQWIERVVNSSPEEKELADLRSQPWVLGHCANSVAFRRPEEILLHSGERILGARFWVPVLPLPDFAHRESEKLRFVGTLPATPETLLQLGECLAERASVDRDAAMHVYGLVEQIVDEDEKLIEQWQSIAEELPVYRLFRGEDRQVTSVQLFLGDEEYTEDLSSFLACLKVGSQLPRGLIGRYRRLGVVERPTAQQIVVALSVIAITQLNARPSYGRLVRALQSVDADSVRQPSLTAVRVLTCAGTFERVSDCYWDEDFGRQGHIVAEHASSLVDTADKSTQKLVQWLRDRGSDAPVRLRAVAALALAEEPMSIEGSPDASYILMPWRQWALEVVREESMLQDSLIKSGLAPANRPLEIVAVERIRVRCSLPNARLIEQHPAWDGPLAVGTNDGIVFVRVLPGTDHRVDAEWVSAVDAAIAREVAVLWGGASDGVSIESRVEEIVATVERPSTVLRRLRKTYRQHFLHQYHDQVADPAFAELFEEYQRTLPSSRRAEELEQRMNHLLEAGFVKARRDQIRGYGYDEFSVFAELLQNGEDAYAQRALLGMQMPSPCGISYRYVRTADGRRVLEVDHRGRPFNYWQHGSQQYRAFSRDVEGVLRSAGSFKPHSYAENPSKPDAAPIGRFGLGFKSVYLLTDLPEIHSGAWHFAIEAGCLPREEPLPQNLPEDVTRIRLPLRGDAQELRNASRLLDLLPFLRMITHLEFETPETAVNVNVTSEKVLVSDSSVVERVVVSAPGTTPGGQLRLIRCRSREHAGQIGLLLTGEAAPARWRDAFGCDVFAALPLRAELGCGVAVSHRFEVQSGRTHLVDPEANKHLIREVADLLHGLVAGLCAENPQGSSEALRRFWAVWRWERGDAECAALRKELARVLVGLPDRELVVPTLAPEALTSLAEGPRFFFSEIPDAFREALVTASVTISKVADGDTALSRSNVVAEGFAGAYRRACEYAGVPPATTLVAVGWSEIAAAFRERPWFAERPELLSCLGTSVNDEQSRKVATWLALCGVLGEDGQGRPAILLPGELLPQEFPGKRHLPRRFLAQVSRVYDEPALKLLSGAGLRPYPSVDDIREWVCASDFTTTEGIGVLRYLAESDRFRNYWELADLFRSAWLPVAQGRLSSVDAAACGVIPEDVLTERLFRVWLGIGGADESSVPPEPTGPRWDTQEVLTELFDWWQVHGASWTAEYERRLYPEGHPPNVRQRFNAQDLDDRRQWLTLLVLGSLHTLGRTQIEQHRDFLRRCDTKGWLDVFADIKQDGQQWIEILEAYLDDPMGNHEYYLWMKQFVVIFQISRWLPEYVDALLNVDRFKRPFAIDEIIAPRTSALFSGGGPDAPGLTRGLGIGACFVFRELIRTGVLSQLYAQPYCYVPARRVCGLVDTLGSLEIRAMPSMARSSAIHKFLVEQLGDQRASFARSFDLPLLALADTPDLQDALLGGPLVLDDDTIG